MKLKRGKRTILFGLFTGILVIALCSNCGRRSENTIATKSLDDLQKAINVISDRRESEFRILRQQEYAISVLTDNIEKSNTEGMKEKLRDEIIVKRAMIIKAEKNIANQDIILDELFHKRDSIEALNISRIE